MLSARIQRDIWRQTGIYSTVGMSNANPLLAKLALDNEAKHTPTMRANWSYQDVEEKVWSIPKMTDFLGNWQADGETLACSGDFFYQGIGNQQSRPAKESSGSGWSAFVVSCQRD